MRQFILLCIATVLLTSCGSRVSAPQDGGDTVCFKYATLLTLVKHDGYSVAQISNPWKKGETLHTYVMVPRGQEMPDASDLPASATIIRTPVKRAAVFTTVHCSLLDMLHCQQSIVAVADAKYIKVPYVQTQLQKHRIIDCGSGLQPVVEKIMDVKPDIIMLSPFENSGGYGKLEEIDIPLVECADYMESSPLARAEWMKFYGMLFGAERTSTHYFATVDSNYQALVERARQAGEGRTVLFDRMVGSVWHVPGGKSTIGQMVKDARGRYPWAADPHSGSLSLPFENVLEKAGESDVWLFRYSSDHTYTRSDLLGERDGYQQLKAFRQGEMYGCNVEQTLFYEETPFRPDLLLSDFIQLMHPSMPRFAPLRYFQKTK